MKTFFAIISMFLFALPAFASSPACLYQDVQSGPATGGEGGNGIYLDIYGLNFGATQGASTVTVNGTPVAQYLYWGADPTGERQQIGVQIASGTTGTGNIVVTTPGGSCSNLIFTVRSGNIYYIGPGIDNDNPSSGGGNLCSNLMNGTAGGGAGGTGTYSSPWTLTNYASTTESSYSYSAMRTPYTYYNCISAGDTLVFLNGTSYPYFDGRGWHASLTPDKTSTSSSFVTLMARPGATATLGAEGWAQQGIRNTGAATYTVYAGLTLVGSGSNGEGISFDEHDRLVGLTIMCPDCAGPAGAVESSIDLTGVGGYTMDGSVITAVSTDTSKLPNGSNKTYHDAYFSGSDFEFAWNRVYNTAAYNGFQINYGDYQQTSGFYNFSIHDNDIADVNGSCINLSDIDPSSGYVQVYNNVLHHCGVNLASDGGADDPHSCIAVKGYGSATGVGTAYIWNNTMFDCSSYLNTITGSGTSGGESCAVLIPASQLNVTTNLVNNVAYQPAYTYTSLNNAYVCGDGTAGTISGSNNIWYSASTPGSTAYATAVGTIENPLFVNSTDGAWTNYRLQSSSPAIGAGLRVGSIESSGISNTYLTWDFVHTTRPSPPSIGALEYGSTSLADQITVTATPNPATLGQSVTLTATVGQTTSSVPTGSINFLNGSVSLGQASLTSEGTATLVLSSLSAGSYAVVGSYSGDSHYPAGESDVVSLQVLSTTETTLVASPNPVTVGHALDLTATVSGTTSPYGTVSFMNGSTVLGVAPLNSSGVATLSTMSLGAGTYSLTAQYSGTTSFLASTSAAASVTVNASTATTSTSLVASPNPMIAGQPLDLTATVRASGTTSPSGTVSFMNGSALLGTAVLNSSGVATLPITSLGAGTYSLTAQYSGTASFLASTSAAASVTVNAPTATVTISLVASPNPVTEGQALVLTATVSESGTTSPTGTVSFMNGSTVMGTAALNSSGVATLSITSLAVGTYSLTAQYPVIASPTPQGSGSASTVASASATVLVTVNAATAPIVPSFSMTVTGSTPSSVLPGETAVYSLVVTPTSVTTLPAITFAAAGLPAGATAIFSPQKIAAGSSATNVTLSIQAPAAQSAHLERNREMGRGLPVVALCLLLLPFGRSSRRFGKRMMRLSSMMLLLAGAASLTGLTGCGADVYSSLSAQTYTVTVTSASALVSQTAQVTLAIE